MGKEPEAENTARSGCQGPSSGQTASLGGLLSVKQADPNLFLCPGASSEEEIIQFRVRFIHNLLELLGVCLNSRYCY